MVLADTSVIMDNPELLLNPDIYLVRETLEELDNLKNKHGTTGFLARRVCKLLNSIKFNRYVNTPINVKHNIVDKVLLEIVKITPSIKVITADINLVNFFLSYGLEAELVSFRRELPEAYFSEDVSPNQLTSILNEEVTQIKDNTPNKYGIINPSGGSVLAFSKAGKVRKIKECTVRVNGSACISARNKEQIFLIDSLLHTDIPLVMVNGRAGTGKTLISIVCGLYQVLRQQYKKILILTPPIQLGDKDRLGFFPGNKDEKLRNYFGGARDALDYLLGDKWQNEYAGLIDFESTTLTRGRSYRDMFIILDEAQNTVPAEMLTIITRIGEGSKLVIAGDLEQSDISSSTDNTGLGVAINAMHDSNQAVYLEMQKVVRSDLVTEATKRFKEIL